MAKIKKGFYLNYDKDNDILNVSFGSSKRAVSFEKEPEVFYRVDPGSNELVGLTVLGFKESFLKKSQDLSITSALISKVLEHQNKKAFASI